MTVLKWLVVVVFTLGAAASAAMGVMHGQSSRELRAFEATPSTLRAFPGEVAVAPRPSGESAAAPEPAKAEPSEPPAPAAEPEKKEEKKAEARPATPPPAPAASGDGALNLRASDTADVYLDGKKLGGSPLLGVKAKAGPHKVRFDCYDAAGNTVPGQVRTVTVAADAETDVDFACPE